MAWLELRLLSLFGVVIVAAIACGACGKEETIDDYPCPPGGTKLTYDNFGAEFMNANCETCHGQADGDRKGAPDGYDFDTIDAIRARKDRIFARAAEDNTTMPPGPDDPPQADRDKLAEWLSCGAP